MTRCLTLESMPKKRTAPRQTVQRTVPYDLRHSTHTTTNMAAIMNPPLQSWPSTQTTHNMGWGDPHLQYTQQPMMTAYMQPVRPPSIPAPQMQREHLPRPGQSGPWTAEEDAVLLEERSRGSAWDDIHNRHFPGKSGNACRKRHERLLTKARDTNWDDARINNLLLVYGRYRESMWTKIADEVGEKWEDVEKVIFQQRLRNLRVGSRPRQHSRTTSRTSPMPVVYGDYEHPSSQDELEHTDDSGIALGQGAHSRRTSELGTSVLQHQQQHNTAVNATTTSLPSVDHILSEPLKLDYLPSDTHHNGTGYHSDPRLSNGYSYSH